MAIQFEKTYLLEMKIHYLIITFLFLLQNALLAQEDKSAVAYCKEAIEKLNSSNYLETLEDFQKADQLFQQALKGRASISHCNCLEGWSRALVRIDMIEEALEPLERTYEQLDLVGEKGASLKQSLRLRLARINYQLQHYVSAKNRAREYINESRSERGGDHPEQYEAIAIAAHAYLFIDYPETAFKYAERGLKLAKSRGDQNQWTASFIEAMIDSYWQQNKEDKALKMIDRDWLPLLRSIYGEQSDKMAEAYHLKACYLLNYDRYQEAEKALKQSFELYQQNKPNVVEKILRLEDSWFMTHLRQASFEQAWPHLDAQFKELCLSCDEGEMPSSTIALKEFTSKHFFYSKKKLIQLLHEYQLLYLLEYERHPQMDLLTKAMGFGETALKLGEEIWQEESEVRKELIPTLENSIHWQIIVHQKIQEKSASEQNLEQLLQLIWRKKRLKLLRLKQKLKNKVLAEEPLKQERQTQLNLLLSRKQLIKAYRTGDYQEIEFLQKKVANYLKELNVAQEVIDKKLQKFWVIPQSFEPQSLSELRMSLRKDVTYLEYAFFDEVLYAIMLDKEGGDFYELDLEALNLNEFCRKYEQLLYAPTQLKRNPERLWREFIQAARLGYQKLLEPILPKTNNKVEQLLIAADGPLHYLDFGTLLSAKPQVEEGDYSNLPYLIRKYNISYQYSLDSYAAKSSFEDTDLLISCISERTESWRRLLSSRKSQYYSDFNQVNAVKAAKIGIMEGDFIWMDDILTLGLEGDSLDLFDWSKTGQAELQQLLVLLGTNSTIDRLETDLMDFYLSEQMHHPKAVLTSFWATDKRLEFQKDFLNKVLKRQTFAKSWHQQQLKYINEAAMQEAHPYHWAGYKLWALPQDQIAAASPKEVFIETSKNIGIGFLLVLLLIISVLSLLRFKFNNRLK
jgi:hypothetical protein